MGVSHCCCRRSNIRSTSIQCAFPSRNETHQGSASRGRGPVHSLSRPVTIKASSRQRGCKYLSFPFFVCGLSVVVLKLDATNCFPPLSFSFCPTVLVLFCLLLVKQTPPFFLILWHMAFCNRFLRQSQETSPFLFQVNHTASVPSKFNFPQWSLLGIGTHPGEDTRHFQESGHN